jgi:hypothetical protein
MLSKLRRTVVLRECSALCGPRGVRIGSVSSRVQWIHYKEAVVTLTEESTTATSVASAEVFIAPGRSGSLVQVKPRCDNFIGGKCVAPVKRSVHGKRELAVTTFADEADAVRIANDSLYGLGAGVWTRNGNLAYRMGRAVRAGRVWTNCYHLYPAGAAFGEYEISGVGREPPHDAGALLADEESLGQLQHEASRVLLEHPWGRVLAPGLSSLPRVRQRSVPVAGVCYVFVRRRRPNALPVPTAVGCSLHHASAA